MLPVVDLDDERFEEIMEKARKRIPGLFPLWTDYNYHDPGITILELLAWLKETQQFHMDQIGPEHIRQYMMLLGGRQRHVVPASALITVSVPGNSETIPGGSRFWASNIPFETVAARHLGKSRVIRLRTADIESAVGESRLHVPLFGSAPQAGESFQVGFSGPLQKEKEHWLYFKMFHDYPVKRNPIGEGGDFVPLAALTVEYLYGGDFHPVEWWTDETHQFLEDGFFRLRLKEEMTPDEKGFYWIRFTLKEAEYDVPPVLEKVSLHKLKARQTHTLSEAHPFEWNRGETAVVETDTFLGAAGDCEVFLETEDGLQKYQGALERKETENGSRFLLKDTGAGNGGSGLLLCFERDWMEKRLLGIGDGFPGQELDIEIPNLCANGLDLLIETDGDSGCFERWQRVENFSGADKNSRFYTFNEETGKLVFGDGFRGRMPKGRILLAAGVTSLGARGNVKSGTIQKFEKDSQFRVVGNLEAAKGGRNPETLEEFRIRMNKKLERVERAVTYEDYEILARRTPGLMIEKVRAVPASQRIRQDGSVDDNQVALVIKPYSEEPRPALGKAYMQNIRNMLEPRRLIGTSLNILPPEYIGISVFAEIATDYGYRDMKQTALEALEKYFQRRENNFGQTISYGEIYGILDGMEHVVAVRNLSLDAQGNKIRRSLNGDILLPVNGLAYLGEWECVISSIN